MDDHRLYQLMSWLSPAFPVGAFSYSHGIEYAVEAGMVTDEVSLEKWLIAYVEDELGNVGGAMLRAAYEAMVSGDMGLLARALEEARAFVSTPEFALETGAQGQAFWTTLNAAWPMSATPMLKDVLAEGWLPYGSAVGIAGATAKISLDSVLLGFFQASVSNLISAGIRLIPLGQTAGQRILARLQPHAITAVKIVLERDWADVGTAAPLMEWTSIKHETQYTRLFRS